MTQTTYTTNTAHQLAAEARTFAPDAPEVQQAIANGAPIVIVPARTERGWEGPAMLFIDCAPLTQDRIAPWL